MIHLYYHGGSSNHGCEAIVRSTAEILNCPMTLWSTSPDEDTRYGLEKIVDVRKDVYSPVNKKNLLYIKCALEHKLTGSDYGFIRAGHREILDSVNSGDICMSIGGDNYCYSGVEKLGYYNRMLKEKGAKTVLWGCSVEPSVLSEAVVEDLKRYDLITVRETLSYEGLCNAGVTDNVVLCADPAFQLDSEAVELPEGFSSNNTVGINVSPLVAQCGSMVMENYLELVRYILEETDDYVLLVPHVVKKETDDRDALQMIIDRFQGNQRVFMAEDADCLLLKGMISQCKCFVGARTHATIAAYSSCVPTLVSGYSIKARGIAKDLFGTDENYVIPVQTMQSKNDLKEAYCWLIDHADLIHAHLKEIMPAYKARSYLAKEALDNLR